MADDIDLNCSFDGLVVRSHVMALHHARPGEPINVRPLGKSIGDTKTATLVKTDTLELIRIVLPAGKTLAEHKVAGEITIQCLEGELELTAAGKTQVLSPGTLVQLAGNDSHALRSITDASALVTIVLR
jgi:quercetin dioxygenase-like cupin family protein